MKFLLIGFILLKFKQLQELFPKTISYYYKFKHLIIKVIYYFNILLKKKGNVFSSVQGLEFQWDILQNINDIANFGGIIKFVPFKEAKIEIDKQLLEMEQLVIIYL